MVMTRLLSIDKDCLRIDERAQTRAKKITLEWNVIYHRQELDVIYHRQDEPYTLVRLNNRELLSIASVRCHVILPALMPFTE